MENNPISLSDCCLIIPIWARRCHFCQKDITGSQSELNRHILRAHCNEKSHKCDLCGKKFTARDTLNRHKKNLHTNEDITKVHQCENCNMKFKYNGQLTSHVKKVHETQAFQTKFECEICQKTYKTKYHLQRHSDLVHVNNTTGCFIWNFGISNGCSTKMVHIWPYVGKAKMCLRSGSFLWQKIIVWKSKKITKFLQK